RSCTPRWSSRSLITRVTCAGDSPSLRAPAAKPFSATTFLNTLMEWSLSMGFRIGAALATGLTNAPRFTPATMGTHADAPYGRDLGPTGHVAWYEGIGDTIVQSIRVHASGVMAPQSRKSPFTKRRAMPAESPIRYELRFAALFHRGRGYAFPCDAHGHVDIDS